MEIRDISGNYSPLRDQSVNNNDPGVNAQSVNKNETGNGKDKIQISGEARKLQGKNLETKNLSAIQDKITNNFYNSAEVINYTAAEILKEFGKK